MKGGGPPPGDAIVEIWTDDPEIDFPEAAPLFPSRRALGHLARRWQAHDRAAETQGLRPAIWARAVPDGSFEVPIPRDLAWFRVEVDAEFARSREVRYRLVGTPEVEAGLTIVLEPAGKVEGTAHSTSSLDRALVRLERTTVDEAPIARIDGAGHFEIRGVPPGLYSAGAFVEGFAPAEFREIEVRAGDVTRLDFRPVPEASVSGTVVDEEGRGIARARVEVLSVGGIVSLPPPFGTAKADSESVFRVGSLPSGEHLLRVEEPGYLYQGGIEIRLAPGEARTGVRIVLERGRSIAGRVLGPDGQGVSQASLTASVDPEAWRKNRPGENPPWSRQESESSPDGSFRISGLAEGFFQVFGFHPEFGASSVAGIESGREDLEIVLPGLGAIAGRVHDAETGAPVRRFRVGVRMFSGSAGPAMVSTDDLHARWFDTEDGSFERRDLQRGTYRFHFEAPGFAAHTEPDVEVKPGERVEGIEVALRRAGSIRGRVVERGTGTPIAGAEVRWVREDSNATGEESRDPATSAPDGSFELMDLEPGAGRCVAKDEEFLLSASEPVLLRTDRPLGGVLVSLERGGGIDGYARGPDGSPYVGADVRAEHVALDADGETEVSPDGYFLLEGLRPGRYVVRADPPDADDHGLGAVAVVEAGRTTRVDFDEASRGRCRVRGRVFRGESPVPDLSIDLVPAGADRDPELSALYAGRFHRWTDEEGRYEMRGAPPGDARLRLDARGVALEVPLSIPEVSDLEFDVRIPVGVVEGRVVRESDRSPVPRVLVTIRKAEGSLDGSMRSSRGAVSANREGRFRFEGLLPGRYLLHTLPDQRGTEALAPASVGPVTVGEAGTTTVEVVMRAGGRAAVHVVDPEGKPLQGASVRLFRGPGIAEAAAPLRFSGPQQSTGPEGIARFEGLAPGRYVAGVTGVSFGVPPCEAREVRADEEVSFRIELTAGVRVRIRLRSEDARDIGYPQAILVDAQGRRFEARFPRGSWVDPSTAAVGTTVLHPGEYVLTARAAGHVDKTLTVNVIGPSEEEITVSLEPLRPRK